jgi:hypothetical protein
VAASSRLRTWALDRGFALGAAALVTYIWLAPSHVVAADDAELATLGAVGGRAHPSGFPIVVLWLRALSWLPVGSPAHRAAVATAIVAAIQVVVLHAACRAWGARPLAATLATAVVAAAPAVLRVHVESDVFAENSLIASLVLWLAAPSPPLRGVRRAFALGLIGGLGLSGNLTCVLIAPVGLYGVACAIREGSRRSVAGALALAGLAFGLVPYAYLFVAPDAASWAPVDSFGDLLDTFLRRDYGSVSNLPTGDHVPLPTSLGGSVMLVGRSWLWLPALAGLAALGARAWRGDARWGWRGLAASWLLCGPVFATRIDIAPDGVGAVGAYLVSRLEILSVVVLAVPVAAAFDAGLARAPRFTDLARGTALALAVFALLVATALPTLDRVHSPAVEAGSRNLLASLPQGAIVVVVSEDQCFGVRYLQLAEGVRPDVTLICWTITMRGWYTARLAAQGVVVDVSTGGPAPVEEVERWLATGRPVVVDSAQKPALTLPSYPLGVLYRVLPRGSQAPSPRDALDLQRETFASFDLDYPRPRADDGFAAVAHERYALAWRHLGRALAAAGDTDDATEALALAAQLAPEP